MKNSNCELFCDFWGFPYTCHYWFLSCIFAPFLIVFKKDTETRIELIAETWIKMFPLIYISKSAGGLIIFIFYLEVRP